MGTGTKTGMQLRLLHGLIGKLGIDSDTKADMIYRLTDGRTSSAGDLNYMEAKTLIDFLQEQVKGMGLGNVEQTKRAASMQKMRRMILSCCYGLHWVKDGVVDYDRLDAFLLKYGVVKKRFKLLGYNDLVRVVTQFKHIELKDLK